MNRVTLVLLILALIVIGYLAVSLSDRTDSLKQSIQRERDLKARYDTVKVLALQWNHDFLTMELRYQDEKKRRITAEANNEISRLKYEQVRKTFIHYTDSATNSELAELYPR